MKASLAFYKPWFPRPATGSNRATSKGFRQMLRSARRENRDHALACRVEDGVILGGLNLSQIARGSFQSAFLGYWIGAPYRREGYMSQAIPLFLDHAFGALKLHRIEANICPENKPSIALVQRVGFRCEGLGRRYLKIDGRWRDHEHWTILSEDWRAGRRRRKA
jgi:ribosomal-protein-alanine N-acetyltransferase